jgi:cell division protein ZipA
MAELRWILLAAGLALIAGIYLWGIRARLRSAATEARRSVSVEPPAAASGPPEAAEPARHEPQLRQDDHRVPEVHEVVPLVEAREFSQQSGRREPTLGQRLTAPQPRPTQPLEPVPPARPAPTPAAEDHESQTLVEARAQRIIALRVVAPLPSLFEGSLLLEAVQAERFVFGRYEIFHRPDAEGRAVLSLASLREPGTFDPATMAGAAYAGVALFAVLPGPLSGQQAFEELLAAARSLAGHLGGHMQDERGVPLTAQRVVRLREEMQALDRGRSGPARR